LNCATIIATIALVVTGLAHSQTVQEVAVSYKRPANVPGASDVQIRTLRFRPMHATEPQDTFKALDDFHVTRLEWTYLEAYEPGTVDAAGLSEDLEKYGASRSRDAFSAAPPTAAVEPLCNGTT